MYYAHGGMLAGIVFYLFFWILIIGGGIMLVWSLSRKGPGEKREDTALEILKKRYARGEISKEEFEEKRRDIIS